MHIYEMYGYIDRQHDRRVTRWMTTFQTKTKNHTDVETNGQNAAHLGSQDSGSKQNTHTQVWLNLLQGPSLLFESCQRR